MEQLKLGFLSIDFGTTKSLITYATPTSQAKIMGECPTAVLFTDECNRTETNYKIGLDALEISSSASWRYFKLDMGKEKVEYYRRKDMLLPGLEEPEPHHLAALIFRELRRQLLINLYSSSMDNQEIEQKFSNVEIGPVTITVPAESDFKKRQATIFAARVAGFFDINILEEPVAAYLYHLYKPNSILEKNIKENTTSLVIDFGGGTCDMALVTKNVNSSTPIVLSTRTVKLGDPKLDFGGNDIDESIVAKWVEMEQSNIGLENEDVPIAADIRNQLMKDAIVAKLMMNPVPSNMYEKTEMMKRPFGNRRYGKIDRDPYLLTNGQLLLPLELSPDELDEIWYKYKEFIDTDLKLLLGNIKPDYIILSGGSSYLRQYINFIKTKFGVIGENNKEIDKYILFDEPEKVVAIGALEHERHGRCLSTILPMSVYLELDYQYHDVPKKKRERCQIEYIHYQEKSYIQLASKNDAISKKHFRNIYHRPKHRKLIPVLSNQIELNWNIIQVRKSNNDDYDYKNIGISSYVISNIYRKFGSPPLSKIINLRYEFNQFGDIIYRVEPYPTLNLKCLTQWDNETPNGDFDWRQTENVIHNRQKYFMH